MLTDPNGEWLLTTLALVWLFTSETGYDIQKYISPIAIHIDFTSGSHLGGVGIDISVGIPQIAPISYRVHAGATYYWKNDFTGPGWETRYGSEWGLYGLAIVGGTVYDSPGEEFDQTLNHVRIGPPGLNLKYANDWFFDLNLPGIPNADGGDRFRTGAGKLQLGPLHVGFSIFTGDPGLLDEDRVEENGFYQNSKHGSDPNKYRAGIGYVRFGPFSLGRDSEDIRYNIQNDIIHNNIGSPYFSYVNYPSRWYFQFGWGLGRLW